MDNDILPPGNKPARPPAGVSPLNADSDTPAPPAPPPKKDDDASTGSGAPLSADKPPSAWRELLSTVVILATAFLVAVLIVSFVFRSYQVDGPSMQSTLHNNDKLIIWKLPRTWAGITNHDYVPSRGDIIVFNQKGLSMFGQQDSKQLIKRVIGLPGDRVVVDDGVVTIYNHQHPNGFQPDKTMSYGKVIPYTSGHIDKTLGRHQLFVCGDNRPDSLDSRSFGPINTNQVVGKLVLRVFPLSQAETF